MRRSIIILSLVIGYCFLAGFQKRAAHTTINYDRYFDTASFHIDTVIDPVNVAGKLYTFIYLRHREEDECNLYSGLVIMDREHHKTAFLDTSRSFEATYALYKPAAKSLGKNGDLFFSTIQSGCGSGYSGDMFTVQASGDKITLARVFEFGELSLIKFGKYGNRVLRMYGIWGDGESHFEDHKYVIEVYSRKDSYGWSVCNIGTTKYKYPSAAEDVIDHVLPMIKNREPHIFETVYDTTTLQLLGKKPAKK